MPKIGSTPPSGKPPLRPYQVAGVRWLSAVGSGLLADEMGLGKSRMLIEASEGETLVVMPSMLLDSGSWAQQVELWGDDPSRFTFVGWHQLTETRREMRVLKKFEDWYENLETVAESHDENGKRLPRPDHHYRPVTIHLPKLAARLDREWDTVILDEAHYAKNQKANRTAAIKQLRKKAGAWYMATGTPVPNWAHELFVILQLLWPEHAVPGGKFGSRDRWLREWFFTAPNRFAPNVLDIGGLRHCRPECRNTDPANPCEHFTYFARENLGGRFLQRMASEVQKDLPPITTEEVLVPLTARQWKSYKEMRDRQITQLRDESEEVLTAWWKSSRWIYLDRIQSGLGLADNKVDLRESSKLDRLAFDLERRTRPTLVMAHFRNTVEAAHEVATKLGLRSMYVHGGTPAEDRMKAVQGFQGGELDVLVGSIDTLAEGLTLTAADMVIFLEKSWRPHKNQQALKRIHRMGQTRPCYVLDYVATAPNGDAILDGHKREVVADKTDEQVRTLSAARREAML